MDVLKLLRSKNRCLERFLEVTESFWGKAQNGDLQGLDRFQLDRDAALKAIDLFDRKIAEAASLLSKDALTFELKQAVEKCLAEREILIHQILETDLKIIGKIEEAKSAALKDLRSSAKSREILKKFKSTWIAEAGEEIDEKL